MKFLALFLLLPGLLMAEALKPNIIYILADDLGIGDLGCYGQKKLKTPNIDRLAKEGLRFTEHYSGNTVCSPTRAILMTGQHPGVVHCRGNGNEDGFALDPKMTTLPRLFKNAGYATGAFGKWGLGTTSTPGATDPRTHGFDHYTGWKSQMIAHTYYPKVIVRDGKEQALKKGTFIHDLIMEDASKFIQKNAAAKTPFFCYIPTAVPHAAMHAPKEMHDKWCQVYPQFNNLTGKYGAGPDNDCPPVQNPVAGFAAMMENLDNQIGAILNSLKELGIDDNTIVLFSSDNGAHKEGGHKPEFWDSNGPYRGIKRDLYEGGIHTPFLVRWPGKIKAGTDSSHLSAHWDILATMAELTGQALPEQNSGISMVPTFLGKKDKQQKHEHLYFEFIRGKKTTFTSRALRLDNWKAVQRSQKNRGEHFLPIELYDLTTDLRESKNLADKHPEQVLKMKKLMDEAHTPLPPKEIKKITQR